MDKSVILYNASWCGYCKQVRTILARNQISYTVLEIERPRTSKPSCASGSATSGLSGTVHLGSEFPRSTSRRRSRGREPVSSRSAGTLHPAHVHRGRYRQIPGDDLRPDAHARPCAIAPRTAKRRRDLIDERQSDDGGLDPQRKSALGSGSTDGYGGGICICSDPGNLTVRNSTFTGNLAGGSGGAIYDDDSPVTITGSTFSGNQAYYRGGAASFSSTYPPGVAIQNSTFTGNQADRDRRGGLRRWRHLLLRARDDHSSTVAGNSASRGGGVNLDSPVPPAGCPAQHDRRQQQRQRGGSRSARSVRLGVQPGQGHRRREHDNRPGSNVFAHGSPAHWSGVQRRFDPDDEAGVDQPGDRQGRGVRPHHRSAGQRPPG